MKLSEVAKAMQENTERQYQDIISQAETAGYTTSDPYLKHVQFLALSNTLQRLSGKLTKLQQHLSDLKNAVADSDRKLSQALAGAQCFAVASDSLDMSGVKKLLQAQIIDLTNVSDSSTNWPFSDRKAVNDETLQLTQEFAALADIPSYNDWKVMDGVKDRLVAFSTTLTADTNYINSLNPDSSDRVTAVGKAKTVLAHFSLLNGLENSELTNIKDRFECNDDTQKATYTLMVNDLTDNKTPASVEVVTFTCYATLSLSGGIGFNSLAERTYQLVTPPGATATGTTTTGMTAPASTIQYDKNSSFQIAPLLLLNVRIHNIGDCCALHASFGAGVSIPASGSGTTSGTGSQATYLGGLSASLRDKLYFTFGPYFGRTNKLANGYSISSSLPSGVTTIPLQTKFSAGLGVAVTFKLK